LSHHMQSCFATSCLICDCAPSTSISKSDASLSAIPIQLRNLSMKPQPYPRSGGEVPPHPDNSTKSGTAQLNRTRTHELCLAASRCSPTPCRRASSGIVVVSALNPRLFRSKHCASFAPGSLCTEHICYYHTYFNLCTFIGSFVIVSWPNCM
jgi:hypothetical protein